MGSGRSLCGELFVELVVLLKNSTRNELLCGYLMIFVVWSFGRSYQPWLKVDWLRVQVKIAKNKELNHKLSARNWTDPPICLPQ